MGLFSTLASTTPGIKDGAFAASSSSSSSASIPTIVQLYTGDRPILLEDTSHVSGYTALTYQAVQVSAFDFPHEDAANSNSNSNNRNPSTHRQQHLSPDLGVWNCRVPSQEAAATAALPGGAGGDAATSSLVDSLLARVASKATTYALTVSLADETSVEPTLNLLKAALVRHLMDHPPPPVGAAPPSGRAAGGRDGGGGGDEEHDGGATVDATSDGGKSAGGATRTTSLFDLQATPFGLAPQDTATAGTIDEATADVKIGLMICAVVPSGAPDGGGGDEPLDGEAAYRQKQARALVVYHLRKFANAVQASLCFVEEPPSDRTPDVVPSLSAAASSSPTKDPSHQQQPGGGGGGGNDETQPAVSYGTLSQLWRDLAAGVPVWQIGAAADGPAAVVIEDDGGGGDFATVGATALYGPGRQQEDLIESVLLRNANYPGHWEASRDSLWVALPTPADPLPPGAAANAGDGGWLNQLRDSIASALPAAPSSGAADGGGSGTDDSSAGKKPKEKDAAVSSFFESLLKNP